MLNALRLKLPNALRVTETRLETTYEQRKTRDSRTHPYKPGGCMLLASFSRSQAYLNLVGGVLSQQFANCNPYAPD